MSILHLTLKKKWFDLIANGLKKFEYREVKQFWFTRFFDQQLLCDVTVNIDTGEFIGPGVKQYTEIHFRNGYGADKPLVVVKWNGIYFTKECQNGEPLNNKFHFGLKLGKIVKIENWSQPCIAE